MSFNRAIFIVRIGLALGLLISCSGVQDIDNSRPIADFVGEMAVKHDFNESELHDLFQSVHIDQAVLDKIASPAEGLPWYQYRKIFLTPARIEGGVKFLKNHAEIFAAVEQRYGIPPEIITAILGVETNYGAITGKHRVIDALATLAFAYPPRSKFFSAELENFLLLCREEHLNPLEPEGSYAGAMGMPQFMPSSFRSYAADFDNDGRRDIWRNPGDVIASVANYFAAHGWQRGQIVAVPASAADDKYRSLLNTNLKDFLRIDVIESTGVQISHPLPLNSKVKLLDFKHEHGEELWAVLNNFYVITRYNHSPLYAMAVYQLSQAISKQIN